MRAAIPLISLALACSSSTPEPGPAVLESQPADPAVAGSEAADSAGEPTAGEAAAGPEGRVAGILEAHNRYRSKHCVPPLSWSGELAAGAERWAQRIAASGCRLEHAPGVPEGENLAWVAPVGASDAAGIVQRWYDEIAAYDFDDGGFSMQTGHFTQLIWAGTDRLGCAVDVCNDGNIWVCRYAPPGNVQGMYAENVKPPCK